MQTVIPAAQHSAGHELEPSGLLTLSRLRDTTTGQYIHMAHCTICKSARHFGAWEDALDFTTKHVTTHWAV